ncbi:global transcription factor [Cucumis melo var. makuwa]|uniref:Global transcription factor n=1 Tax=Cucumis melo var. makuwa TaxID=1194695 RepID=A0A5D3DSF1_CUCMM|nr:global transcription factor [Cucumis melo var. makuwa]TYK26392.1 global transcription factor [Cucumis melo var. makuwa]
MYCVGKASPDRLYRAALLWNRFADTILKAREKIAKRRLAASYGRRKAEAEVAATARDGNDDGTDGGELRTTTNVSLFPEPFPFRFQFCVK